MDITHGTPELFAAIAAAQGEIENASKNAANPHFKSKYADLAEVLNTVRPVFARHGLGIVQGTAFDPTSNTVSVTTAITHASGGWMAATASCVPGKVDAQGVGAATTYLRRYALAGMCGVAQEDDDGNSGAHTRKEAPASAAQVAGIRSALVELGTDMGAFEQWLGCPLAEMTVPMVPRVQEAIAAKRAKAGAK